MIGYEVSEVLEVKLAEYFVQATKREKRACKKCEEQGVTMAPMVWAMRRELLAGSYGLCVTQQFGHILHFHSALKQNAGKSVAAAVMHRTGGPRAAQLRKPVQLAPPHVSDHADILFVVSAEDKSAMGLNPLPNSRRHEWWSWHVKRSAPPCMRERPFRWWSVPFPAAGLWGPMGQGPGCSRSRPFRSGRLRPGPFPTPTPRCSCGGTFC